MRLPPLLSFCLILFALLSLPVNPAIGNTYISNFSSINSSTSAIGVWRNDTGGFDVSVPISLTVTGGTIAPSGSDPGNSRTDGSFSWADNPTTSANYFEPNFTGDRINIQVASNSTATISVEFGAYIIDPTLFVFDLATDITISVANPCTRTGGSNNFAGNLMATIANNRGGDPFFQGLSVGSANLRGPYERVSFSITNENMVAGNTVSVGICFASLFSPTDQQGAKPQLRYYRTTTDRYVDWSRAGAMQLLEYDIGDGLWSVLGGINPETVPSWRINFSSTKRQFFRGRYEFASPPQQIVAAMQHHLATVGLNEFDDSSVVAWLPGRPFAYNQKIYQDGVAVYRQETIFGIKTLQARALILNGSVDRWVFALSGVGIN